MVRCSGRPFSAFDNQWLEELGIYDPTSQTLDESRVQGMTRVFMKTLLDKESTDAGILDGSGTL